VWKDELTNPNQMTENGDQVGVYENSKRGTSYYLLNYK